MVESDNSMTEQDIRDYVKIAAEMGTISKWAVPDVRFVEALAKTSVGKLDKKYRQLYPGQPEKLNLTLGICSFSTLSILKYRVLIDSIFED